MNLPCSLRSPRSGAGLVLAGVIIAAGSAGCSTNQSDVASARQRPSTAPAAGQPKASAAPTAPGSAPASGPGSAAAPAPCQTDDLSVVAAGKTDREGRNVATFAVTDTGSGACTLSGAPLITPQGPLSGQASMEANLAVSQQDLDPPADAAPGSTVTIRPGRSADFDLGWYSESSVVCETADGFGFDAPGDTVSSDAFPVGYAFGSMCDGLFYVSPVYSTR